MAELLFKDEVYAIVGAAMEVHREKGFGFVEPVYQECLEMELLDRKIPAVTQKELPIYYKGRLLKKTYIADLVAHDKIIIELKALDKLTSREESQVINYLKSSGLESRRADKFWRPQPGMEKNCTNESENGIKIIRDNSRIKAI